jgi:hypothetical protein
LPVGGFGKANRAGSSDALQPRGYVDSIAHEVAVRLLDDVADMDSDAKYDALVVGQSRVSLDHRVLDLGRAAHGVYHAAKLNYCAVARALDDPSVVHRDGRIDQVAAERSEARKDPVLVSTGKPAISDDVSR